MPAESTKKNQSMADAMDVDNPKSESTNVNEPSKPASSKKKKEEELSEEDLQLISNLELLVLRLQDVDPNIQKNALEALKNEIRSSTSSMTSVPKPLKFLRPHYNTVKEYHQNLTFSDDHPNKLLLSDILSVMGMTMGKPEDRDSLKFKMKGHLDDLGAWGHDYVRHLSKEVMDEVLFLEEKQLPHPEILTQLVDHIVPFFFKYNAEVDAVDLLLEVDQCDKILQHADAKNYHRVCLYLLSLSMYVGEPDDIALLRIALSLYKKFECPAEALRIALRLNDAQEIKSIYTEEKNNAAMKKQLAYILGRQFYYVQEEDAELSELINNTNLTTRFHDLARELDMTEAKTPEDIYKTHLIESRYSSNVDSAKHNLASTFVNAFVNAGYGHDKIMFQDGHKWIFKNKAHGMISATASLGMILMWDVGGGLSSIDNYLYSKDEYIKAGALMAIGILNSGVRDECDPVIGLLGEYLDEEHNLSIRIGAIMGLGIAYASTAREDLLEKLIRIVENPDSPIELIAHTAIAMGQIFVSTAHPALAELLIVTLMDRDQEQLKTSTYTRFICLGLGLLFMGKQELVDTTLLALETIQGPVGLYARVTVESCAYSCSGDVLRVQKMLHHCNEHLKENNEFQAVAVIGIALIAYGENLGSEMCLRSFDHLLQYGEAVIRRAVPLALGLISVSKADNTIMDTLSKLSHDTDVEVALCAIFALGLLGAGTNNYRIALLLRQLSAFYKDANHLFVIRIAQGMVHTGKGLITLAPVHSNNLLYHRVALSGLLTVLHGFIDSKNIMLGKSHYLLYNLACAMYPRMLITLDQDLNPLKLTVRVGIAVDTVAQAGTPKTITGFQTHTTPVILQQGERAELATEEYIPLTKILEGIVILKPNPNYVKPDEN